LILACRYLRYYRCCFYFTNWLYSFSNSSPSLSSYKLP